MDKQIIISISREFGSCGHAVAEKVAEDLGIALYDRNMLDAIAKDNNLEANTLAKYDEKPKNPIFSRRVGEFSNSMEDVLVELQFDYLQKKAKAGESFVVVGRCGETALKDFDKLVSVFVKGDRQTKRTHVKAKYNLTEEEAEQKMSRHDSKRKAYHNRHSEFKWGDSRGYDLCINSSPLGVKKTAEVIEAYVKAIS